MTERIIELIAEACALKEENITTETLMKEISLDSLSFISLIVNLEKEFGIEFDDEQLNIYDWETVTNIIKIVEEKVNEKNGK